MNNFGSKISLSTVLATLLTITNNLEVLNLHAKDQTASHSVLLGWMNCLAFAFFDTLGKNVSEFFTPDEHFDDMSDQKKKTNELSKKS